MATKMKAKRPANSSAEAKPRETLPLMFTVPPGSSGLLSKAQIAALIGIGPSMFKEMVANEKYPPPDTYIGKLPRWSVPTHNNWIAERCQPKGKV